MRTQEINTWFQPYDNPMEPVVQRAHEIILAAETCKDELKAIVKAWIASKV